MTIAPFVFASLVMGISSATDVRQVGRIGIKILAIYFVTTTIATTFGILGGLILKPGAGLSLGTIELSGQYEAVESSFADVMLGFIPTNIVASFAEGDMILISNEAASVSTGGSSPDLSSYAKADLSNVTGQLPIANGGTGVTAVGTAGQVLTTNSGATGTEWTTPTGA